MAKSKGKPFLGVDLGGTNLRVGIIDAEDKVVAVEKARTKAELGGDAVIKRITKVTKKLLENNKLSAGDVGGLGIGGPGAIDIKKGVVLNAPNLGWKEFNLAKALSDRLEMPVAVDNDVNVAVYGEVKAGAAKKFDDVLGIWMGTGVGGAIVLGGKLYYGHYLTAGEIGHTILHPGAALGRRTFENCASRTNIARIIIELIRANHPSKVTKLVDGDYTRVRSKVIAKAVKEDDELARTVVREAAHFTGIAAANFVTTLSLPCVVLGGGLATELGDIWVKWVRESFERYVFPKALRDAKIVGTKLGDDAGVVGAGIIARERLGKEE